MDTAELKVVIEAMVFASETPLRPERVAEALEIDRSAAKAVLDDLVGEYQRLGRGFVLLEAAEGYQFRTRPEHGEWLRRVLRNRPFRFSRAALETLAIIAYRQPITRAEIEYLRGVDSGGVVKTLLEKHLVRILGKKDIPGRPMIYGTTREFLELFGLRDLRGLPTLKEFSELSLDSSPLEEEGVTESSAPSREELN
ncbi:segregation and condensation protein B [Desulfuromonas versatilis]|uniref:Segregation and condensation protein B n=1 Tax=Desulfuromonas versatilis TaxID=2802975 RepID=A0ABM8HWL4_9BACT|nr:SMC-Scp complex subunit ScpB [Desulfuromonas versatilis]BCR05160.1 segregation and condensation protein B [Desulfuromonas versatilis]